MNAVIMAAGTASRFAPLSYEKPKGLLEVKGEVLIERQIRQLKEAGVEDITIVVGYKADMFRYLVEKYGVSLVVNEDYDRYNNISSLIRVADRLGDTFICCSDNYFPENVFAHMPQSSFYSALYAEGETGEYCLDINEQDEITGVTVGGADSWYMVGHVFFSKDFSERFRQIMLSEYDKPETKAGYWEDLYIRYIDQLPKMKVHRYAPHEIEEFDSLEDLRAFDEKYVNDSGSSIMRHVCTILDCQERDITEISIRKDGMTACIFEFLCLKDGQRYAYDMRYRDMLPKAGPFCRASLLKHLSVIFPGEDVSSAKIRRIGGMSNKNFKVVLNEKKYVLRVPGYGSDGMVDRTNEEFNAIEGCKMGVNPRIRYFDPSTGVKLSDLVTNAETLDCESIQKEDNMRKVAEIYRKVHKHPYSLKNEFDIFEEINKYEKLLAKSDAVMYEGWAELKPKVMALKDYLQELGVEKCACHNDAVPENFIMDEDGRMFLIDWEYSGDNDPMADIAALFLESGFTKENQEFVLREYFGGEIPENAYKKILCFQVLWDCLWAQWTVIKEANGDDFGTYGIDRYNRAIANLKVICDERF
jgi:CTP:phosphocholine cytidylyltransferase-like protein/thiamine kinase-like enzyme